jgi:LacI family transcriptional regulator
MQYTEGPRVRDKVCKNLVGITSVGFPIVHLPDCSYGMSLLAGILPALKSARYDAQLMLDFEESTRDPNAVPPDCGADGVIVMAPDVDTRVIKVLRSSGVPVIAIGGHSSSTGVPSVDVDNAHGATLATEHLVALGHRRIAHLVGTMDQTSARERRDAFCRVISAHGLSLPEGYVVEATYHGNAIFDTAIRLLGQPNRPTAIFAANDQIALQTIRAAGELGIPVPDRLSVIGFDDIPAASLSHPQLTTIRQPLPKLGALAADLLIQWMSGESLAVKTHHLLTDMVLRGSTAPA